MPHPASRTLASRASPSDLIIARSCGSQNQRGIVFINVVADCGRATCGAIAL
ncbi:MAG: hypothetical protein MI923_17325 [Phycisphaerales bacterium]|nr:hypothetical protein [Phycisphaerales bacterium]